MLNLQLTKRKETNVVLKFIRYTANPKNETNDCIIRSIANATQTPWEDVMREMCDIAIELYNMPNAYEVAKEYMDRRKYSEEYLRSSEELTVAEFCQQHPTGNYVVLTEIHAISIIDGDVYDLQNSLYDRIVSYWKVL